MWQSLEKLEKKTGITFSSLNSSYKIEILIVLFCCYKRSRTNSYNVFKKDINLNSIKANDTINESRKISNFRREFSAATFIAFDVD